MTPDAVTSSGSRAATASLLSELQALVGRRNPPTATVVERGSVDRFAEAIGDPIVVRDDGKPAVPPTFLASLAYQRPALPRGADGHLINVENTFTFVRDPIVGEVITTRAAFTRVAQRGPLLRLDLEVRYADSCGALVGAVTVSFVVDFDGVCTEGLRDNARTASLSSTAEPTFVPHGVARPRAGSPAQRACANVDLRLGRPGDVLPPLVKAPLTAMQFVQYAGASGDFNPIHYDSRAAARAGFPDVVAPGLLKMAFLAQHMTLCAGRTAKLRRLRARYLGFDLPGKSLSSHATIREARIIDERQTIDIDVELRDLEGEAATVGSATLEVLGPDASEDAP